MTERFFREGAKGWWPVAIRIAVRCEGCGAFHTKMAHQNGATREELLGTVALATYMGGGPGAVYGADAVAAFDQCERAAGSVGPTGSHPSRRSNLASTSSGGNGQVTDLGLEAADLEITAIGWSRLERRHARRQERVAPCSNRNTALCLRLADSRRRRAGAGPSPPA